MPKFIIGSKDDFEPLMVVNAKNAKEAIKKFKAQLKPDESFLEDLHEWTINMSFSERFHYDDESEGQKCIAEQEVIRRVNEYFKGAPEYVKIYFSHWNAEMKNEDDHQMQKFPDDMIEWIWRKELDDDEWTSFLAYNLAEIKEI